MSIYKIAFAAALTCLSVSCFIETQPVPVYYNGTLALDWTISGAKDPSACTQSNVASIAVDVLNAGGSLVQSFGARCDVFATSITLPRGGYSARAWLIDSAGSARSTPITLHSVDIVENRKLVVAVDFPASSFF